MTLYILPLIGLDLVLGVQWLSGLGPTVRDWKAQTMEFRWANKVHKLHGLQPQLQEARLHEVEKEARNGQTLFAIQVDHNATTASVIPDDLKALVREYDELFKQPTQLPPHRTIEHRIALKEGTDPVNVRPYRYAHFQKNEIERQVSEMLQTGIIQPSSSPFSSPVLLVKKKDGTWRFCTDYRALNSVTIKDRFPIPTVDDMLDELHGAAFFTKLDLTAGYHQVRMHTDDVPKTAFRTHNGHYEYLVMPFGLCNAPSTFQALMNDIFRPILRKFVLVFFDDILVYSPTWDSHKSHVEQVFSILRQQKLAVKLKKCEFGQRELEYLGHIISDAGVKVDKSKIQAMLDWPTPTTITELRGFLGLTGYYRKFVQDYGIIARPLTNLLRKGSFGWGPEADKAFLKLKDAMTTTPTLALLDFTKTFVIQTDASGDGIGAVLTQDDQPIAFMSRSLGVTKKSWSTYAREMLAIVVAIRTWRPYLIGRHFIIQTDQRSLRYLLEQRILTPEHHDTPMGGHSGVLRTYKRLARLFYWPAMHRVVKQYVAECEICQRAKSTSLAPAGLLQPLPIPDQVWEDISMDFVDGLPRSNGHTTIMVVVDRLTKSAHLVPLAHPYTAKVVAAKFVDYIVKLHGMPRSIVSDRDPIFVSLFWKEFWKLAGTKLRMSSAYHPQTDGQTEVVNRCIEQFLRCFVQNRHTQWSSLLPWAEFWYNTSYHSSTGTTPFQALYGRPPPAIPQYDVGSSTLAEIDEQLASRDELLSELKHQLHKANNRNKQLADAKRREVTLECGSWVYLRLQPYRQRSVLRRTSQKLAHKYFGPFQVEERVGEVAYRLKLPSGSRIHPVFHVSLLKPHVGTTMPAPGALPPLRESGYLHLQPEQVLRRRSVATGTTSHSELLIKWKGLSPEDATWEEEKQVHASFPDFILNLEDKVIVRGEGIDGPICGSRPVRERRPNPRYMD
ncbi:uncharacterized protein K02A2.6-like [Capsella rubella]|uniref:uncharacterized protein K02A2.6-like n=1 Tax=Capsella rubella TaxID=81985 RepID=UPI000CD5ADA0|nr:uncharacterized protein K02A2.6-like [Capsella rubella]